HSSLASGGRYHSPPPPTANGSAFLAGNASRSAARFAPEERHHQGAGKIAPCGGHSARGDMHGHCERNRNRKENSLTRQETPMKSTLVLSGGGAKGDFEVGALQYIYESGYFASAICSTSVGSVNAIQLAHGKDRSTQKAAFDKLKSIWQTELKFNSDMYVEAPWLAGVS